MTNTVDPCKSGHEGATCNVNKTAPRVLVPYIAERPLFWQRADPGTLGKLNSWLDQKIFDSIDVFYFL